MTDKRLLAVEGQSPTCSMDQQKPPQRQDQPDIPGLYREDRRMQHQQES
jgi:hypothetical protein